MTRCRVCEGSLGESGFGPLRIPVSHHYQPSSYPSSFITCDLRQCQLCGLVQNAQDVCGIELIPRFEWVKFNEPSGHLESLAGEILTLPGIHPEALIFGLTQKDRGLLEVIAGRNHRAFAMLDPTGDLGYDGPTSGVAWIQDRVDPVLGADLRSRYGAPFLVVARHFLEHLSCPRLVLSGLRELVAPDGFVIFEVPDCEMPMRLRDPGMLWEEHQLYFTRKTLMAALKALDMEIVRFIAYPSLGETCLAVIARFHQNSRFKGDNSLEEIRLFQEFLDKIHPRVDKVREVVRSWRNPGPVALYGAGHHANTFLTVHNLHGDIACVLDDDPHKAGVLMPASSLAVKPASWLDESDCRICLTSVSYETEKKVAAKHVAFLERGGAFYSIFPERADEFFRSVAPLYSVTERI